MKIKFFLISTLIFLFSCKSLDDASKVLKNEKVRTTDEFLIKKREPLILPPDFKEMPKPNSIEKKKDLSEKDKIKKILNVSESKDNNKNNTSTERSILDKIKSE